MLYQKPQSTGSFYSERSYTCDIVILISLVIGYDATGVFFGVGGLGGGVVFLCECRHVWTHINDTIYTYMFTE